MTAKIQRKSKNMLPSHPQKQSISVKLRIKKK